MCSYTDACSVLHEHSFDVKKKTLKKDSNKVGSGKIAGIAQCKYYIGIIGTLTSNSLQSSSVALASFSCTLSHRHGEIAGGGGGGGGGSQ